MLNIQINKFTNSQKKIKGVSFISFKDLDKEFSRIRKEIQKNTY